MSEPISFEHTAGANLYFRFFNMLGQVFDFSDKTFKALAGATTPYVAAVEYADMGGTGLSGYIADVDFSGMNDNGSKGRFTLKVYDNAAPVDADNPVGNPQSLTVQFGEIGERDIIAQGEVNVTSTAGVAAQISAWLEHGAEPIDVGTMGGATFTADNTTNTMTSTAHGLSNGDRVKLTTAGTLPTGLAATTAYFIISVTANTYQVSLTLAGAAVAFTDDGTGTHKHHNPTCTVVVREHGSSVILFTLAGTIADIPMVSSVSTGVFEMTQATPTFVDDRQYDIQVTITENGNTHTSRHRRVIIG